MDYEFAADPGPRECGMSRKEGGIYWEVGLSRDGSGKPLEYFVLDPAVSLPPGFEPPAQGVMLVDVGGVTHVFDHIGSEHWPLPTDWLEEVRRKGVSAYLPAGTDFSRLTDESMYFPVHDKGRLLNADRLALLVERGTCPAGREGPAHHLGDASCVGWRYEVLSGVRVEGTDREVVREMKTFAYAGRVTPVGFTPEYEPAIIGRFPLGRLVVVNGEQAPQRLASARLAHGVRVDLVEE